MVAIMDIARKTGDSAITEETKQNLTDLFYQTEKHKLWAWGVISAGFFLPTLVTISIPNPFVGALVYGATRLAYFCFGVHFFLFLPPYLFFYHTKPLLCYCRGRRNFFLDVHL